MSEIDGLAADFAAFKKLVDGLRQEHSDLTRHIAAARKQLATIIAEVKDAFEQKITLGGAVETAEAELVKVQAEVAQAKIDRDVAQAAEAVATRDAAAIRKSANREAMQAREQAGVLKTRAMEKFDGK
jgi:predicted  nucleic acid-binding Zn-ribbon protein